MSEVQGTVEFSVELHKFHNVDLFQRGFYQVRASLRVSPRVPHRLIVTTPGNTGECSFSAAGVHDESVFSRIFQILYRNEEISLDDRMNFKVHLLLDGEKVEEALSEVDFQLKLDLHFTDNEQQLGEISTVPLISSRTLGLHFHPRRGLHHHVPVMFDYFHLSVISVSIHASLVALHQPLISFARTGRGVWLGRTSPESESQASLISVENLMFGAGYCKPVLTEGSFYVPSENCLQRAHTWHRRLCRLLLAAYKGLRSYFTALMKEIPELHQLQIEDLPIDETLNQLSIQLQMQEGHEKAAEQISRDLTQLCSQLAELWSQFLQAAVPSAQVLSYLAQEHHTLRVRRFSEAYFFTEHPKETSLTFQEDLINRHSQIATEVRSSDYLTKMPPLPVECLDIDGDWNSLPIIFEDRYVDTPVLDQKLYVPNSTPANTQLSNDPAATETSTSILVESQESQSPALKQEEPSNEDCIDLPTYMTLTDQQKDSAIDRTDSTDEIDSIKRTDSVTRTDSINRAECIDKTDCINRTDSVNRADCINRTDHVDRADFVNLLDPQSEETVVVSSEQTSSSGLTYIAVRPSDTNPYQGEAVLLVQSNITELSNQTDLNRQDLACKEHTHENDIDTQPHIVSQEADGTTRVLDSSYIETSLIQAKDHESEDTFLTTSSLSQTPPTDLMTSSFSHINALRDGRALSLSETTPRAGFLGGSKIMNRSASVISDSGIESEPSSMAWALEGRGGGREILQHLGRRRTAHRSSLEGLQTESHGSLPSGTQASLASISSLPYEEDEQRQLSTLTKSASAPQISSPEDTEEDQDTPNQERPNQEGANQERQNQEGDTEKLTNEEYYGSRHSLHTENGALFDGVIEQCNSETDYCEHDGSGDINKHPTTKGDVDCDHDDDDDDEDEADDDVDVDDEDDISFHQIHLSETGDQTKPLPHLTNEQESHDLTDHPANEKERHSNLIGMITNEKEKEGKGSKGPSSGLAFMNKKVVEVVNLSVSCAPTCLPFSSGLRDSPSVSGLSARQATSPITHQPLGSFGIISPSSSFICADQETNERMINFYKAKESLLKDLVFRASLYSDLPLLASELPYFPPEEDDEEFEDGIHLVVCVHGLDGNSADLRLVKTFIELGLPGSRLDFLMSERNQTDTFADFDTMTDRLLDEIIQHIQLYNLTVGRISFIGHSLGNVIIRSVLTRPRFRCYLSKLHTFLSLSGPHLGTLYNNSPLVSTGLWLMQKLKKSGSLLQLTFRDHTDPRQTFLYQLSQKPGLQFFKNVVLVASPQDRYVPFHSARIEMCRTALKDRTTGPVYTEMISNLLQPVLQAKDCRLIRHNVLHALPNTANTLIGRAAHIAVLDSELFLEKFLLVAGLDYFK
ncbi:protein FAM135B [Chanos chanos]|uniref:Protein FAM135B n=1 Tax=Chanos chanos TaxID=29144 RepID=A0A6J2WHK6_CHACN|nr:protein FAM135B [Chanos chanos]